MTSLLVLALPRVFAAVLRLGCLLLLFVYDEDAMGDDYLTFDTSISSLAVQYRYASPATDEAATVTARRSSRRAPA